MVREVTTNVELKEILQKEKAVVVDFSASWCGPCRNIAPHYETLSKQHLNITFLKVDVDEFEGMEGYQISGMPTFLFFKNDEEVARLVGANLEKLKIELEKLSSQ